MVGGSVPPKLTIGQAQEYIADVKEALKDEPEKYHEFVKILQYVITHRADEVICYARVGELLKDHRDLLLGFNVFLSPESKIPLEAKRIIPLESNRTIPPKSKITITPKTKRTIPRELSDIDSVKEACHDESADGASGFARVVEVMNRNLIQLSSEANTIAIPTEAENHGAESSCTKRKREESDAHSFLEKLKTRFRSLDTHVLGSFLEILKTFKERKKSGKEVHEEVVDLLYYHEDLIEDFSRNFKPKKLRQE